MEKLFFKSPLFLQNLIISLFNTYLYSKRYGRKYKKYKKLFKSQDDLSFNELKNIQNEKFIKFINEAKFKSTFYKKFYKNIDLSTIKSISDIHKLPILKKEDLRKNINEVHTIKPKDGIISKTGGTTGKPLKVVFTIDDTNRRYAYLDNFRGQYGYKLGKKTAWFSGKNLLSKKDIKNNRFWKYDFINKVRYYSTFHINENYLKYYLNDLINFKPEFIVGFPSTLLEIANYGKRNGIVFPKNTIKAIFPTAETVSKEVRQILSIYYNTIVIDQYASSEGAPFIFQCKEGNYHLDIRTGVFEVLDHDNREVNQGRLVVTSFTTHGTPLIRYDIGDMIKKSDSPKCSCNNENPKIDKVIGRLNDYIFSKETGKINLGNVSNTLKGVEGIIKFQVVQKSIEEITILIVTDETFDKKNEKIFLKNWRDRVGQIMKIHVRRVDKILVEKSGKFRIVKNLIS
ncbi:phenylacetate-CoA ligase [Mesoflavibacter sabulilitoris]|uniref:Polysaccharide biosynthesis protein n=1 Tax=Mesoflavibacter zeaxanthinifaciens subsp. sabulilitoris TaxID=1520893 RepID=A0A2T1N6L4_9FLAO|nr:phenylacetate--CoA ligase family protein [Mesoflavibacter zeaxanthinifaciens]MBB3123177.1 phenylacetate-CoA ligase [Mesoflavibacter zeaxanthinifaciens subsp. sabulilitoris]PSG87184.1 polysaccharide biosynthesis protein [Mesoflavibacter zeaxanthinifaciens subsp. sabulilitoris]